MRSAGLRCREPVCVALPKKRRVHERLVVHPYPFVDEVLRVSDRVPGYPSPVARAVPYEELQPRPTLGPPLSPAASHAVSLTRRLELQLDKHIALALVNQVVVIAVSQPRTAPQRERDCVQQRALPMPVVAAQAGQVDIFEVQRRRVVPVTQKVLDGQL